jgi:hypothetical protein
MRPKFAGVGNLGAEEVAELKAKVLTREDVRRETHALFSNADAAQKRDRKVVEKLFVQAPGAVTAPTLAKTASQFSKTAAVDAWFSENGHLFQTEAQRRFPELMKVSAGTTGVSTSTSMATAGSKAPRTATTGTPAVQSNLGRP